MTVPITSIRATLAVALLATLFGTAAHAQTTKAIGMTPAGGAKIATTKDALGNVTGARNVEGRLTDDDGTLNDGTPFDAHTATFTAGQRVLIEMTSSDFDAFLVLGRREADGVVQVASDDDGGGGVNARIELTIDVPGSYVIFANAVSASDRGRYALSVEAESDSARMMFDVSGASSTRIGLPVHGTLTPGQDDRLADGSLYELLSFEARRGQRLQIDLRSGDFDPNLGLLYVGDDGAQLMASNDDNGADLSSRIVFQVPYTGTYVAIVNSYAATDTGTYNFAIRALLDAETSPNENWADRYPGGGSPNNQYALLVGIDDYPGERSDLASCIVDTMEMRRVLIEVLGFRDENIVVINDNEATRDHIITALREHLGQAGPGGSALFYFSGHGLQLESNVGDNDHEPDGVDEAIYVWGQDFNSSIIVDEEIGTLLSGMTAGRKVAVIDSCHSGTGTLGAATAKWVTTKDPWVRETLRMPESYLRAGATKSAEGAMIDGPSGHILLAACAADQVASAGSGGNPSIFTYFLIREMERGGTSQSWIELMDRVEEGLAELRAVRTDIEQTPRVEGAKVGGSLGQYFPKGAG